MKVQIEKSFPMPCSVDVAWEFLQDVEAVAGCMPGAKITERLEDGRYKGTVTVKVGPATMSFRGEVEMTDIDPPARSLRLQRAAPGAALAGAPAAGPGDAPAVEAPPRPPPAAELNGLALMWTIVRDWLRGLFSKKSE